MRFSLAASVTWFILAVYAHGDGGSESEITADGVPAGYKFPVVPEGKRTDFDAIFDAISQSKKVSSRSAQAVQIAARQARATPKYFELSFGPISAANDAPGFMGFETLATHDANACAASCNSKTYDSSSGPCIFFNIWTAVVKGKASTTVCSLYNTVTGNLTATWTGKDDLVVTASRGYKRKNLIKDGSFQDYTCIVTEKNGCPATPSKYWTRFVSAAYDFVLINNGPAHSGTSSAYFYFSPPTSDAYADGATLDYALPLKSVTGKNYVISFFYTNNYFSPAPKDATGPLVSALWNGVSVIDAPPVESTTPDGVSYTNIVKEVTAQGGDTFTLKNGVGFAHALWVDDIAVFEKWY